MFNNPFGRNTQNSVRTCNEVREQKFNHENHVTHTSKEQELVENDVAKMFYDYSLRLQIEPDMNLLKRQNHIEFLTNSLSYLSTSYECLDSSRPWLVFWILNAATLLGHKFPLDLQNRVVLFLEKCRDPKGGFCGGPYQMPHLASTYAAVNALVLIGTPQAYETIDRTSLHNFLLTVRECNGGFCLHENGELDIRGAYCAIAVAKLSGIEDPKLFENTANWIASCQTYEGGFASSPGNEAHGGYSFCGAAGLALLNNSSTCNLQNLLRWTVNRQMRLEGGFQGRTNKLVDGCYSFWQGATVPIIQSLILQNQSSENILENFESIDTIQNSLLAKEILFDHSCLQEYILMACQSPRGGLIDKPGKPRDFYHTCYTLSGLSIAQHISSDSTYCIDGNESLLTRTHLLHNLPPENVKRAVDYFKSKNFEEVNIDKF